MNMLFSLSGHHDQAEAMLVIGCVVLAIGLYFYIIHLIARLGERQGRGYGLWFLLCLLFTPIPIWILLLLLGNNRKTASRQNLFDSFQATEDAANMEEGPNPRRYREGLD